MEPIVACSAIVPAPIEAVWDAWTTESGITSFFGPACHIALRVDGPYEIFFDLEAAPGSRGGEGCRVLAIQRPTMLSFTWNAPPELAEVRDQHTSVVLRLLALDAQSTHVSLTHSGWGLGGQWDQARDYFQQAWGCVVLPRLVHRFTVGPVDWQHPPQRVSSPEGGQL